MLTPLATSGSTGLDGRRRGKNGAPTEEICSANDIVVSAIDDAGLGLSLQPSRKQLAEPKLD
ncbi:hypothetical protein EIB18_14275 [Caulobacter vibrioides]|uniref:Uncharacterized protein n=1 Tax=Caulobacter vibrioides (strain ATCC 19089 / CIP 103742 / CB 15) TaxID=190650 RepID=Q9A4Y2_CAUVC|nr:hypothetical protein CC_2693 [Caulobacter vibrioides CB15]ATC29529.1 hypothetical protein CA607_14545 [Caulobacter vibrioides]AZH13760.1 hypothetical protein EIB18_14275 [Caulobacter vibrioides]